ncbi:MAG: oxygenase MpaB family protein [Candidatus Dormibacteraceae bacterium]
MDDPADPTQRLYRPGSVTWKVNRETVLLLGGGRALLMQLAHPLVAAGVAEHSDFQRRPLDRLARTLELTLSMVFGTREEAVVAARRINQAHRTVQGTLSDGSGGVAAGAPYSARNPDLLLWVHATLVESAVLTYESLVEALTDREKQEYLLESRLVGELLGIPREAFAADWSCFRAYLERMYAGPVRVSDQARRLARGVLDPGLPLVPRAAYAPTNLITTGLLPASLRDGYRLPWGRARRAAYATSLRVIPALVRGAPARLRQMSAYRVASRTPAGQARMSSPGEARTRPKRRGAHRPRAGDPARPRRASPPP